MGVSPVCIFCSKLIDFSQDISNENVTQKPTQLHQNFNRVLQRYLGTSKDINFVDLLSSSCSPLKTSIGICEDCLSVIHTICDSYHQLRCIQIRLDGTIQSLTNIMKMADKIKSRKHLLKMTIEGKQNGEKACVSSNERTEMYRRVKKFRKDFQRKCLRHFVTSFPRVMMRRHEDVSTTKEPSVRKNLDRNGGKSTKSDLIGDRSTTSANGASSTLYSNEIIQEEIVQRLVKWILACSMVIMLTCPFTNPCHSKSTHKRKSKNDLDSDRDALFMTENIEITEEMEAHTTSTELISFRHNPINNAVTRCSINNSSKSSITPEYTLPKCENLISLPTVEEDAGSFYHEDANDDSISMASYNSNPANVEDNSNSIDKLLIESASIPCVPTDTKIDPDPPPLPVKRRPAKRKISQSPPRPHMEVEMGSSTRNPGITGDDGTESDKGTTDASRLPKSRYNLRTTRPSNVFNEDHNSDSDDDYLVDDSENNLSEESDATIDDDPPKPTKNFQCKECQKYFTSEAWLMAHLRKKCGKADTKMQSIHPKSEYFCEEDKCQKSFKNQDELEYHKKQHGYFPCNFCYRVETFARRLCIHEAKHAVRDKKSPHIFYCPQCPFQFHHKATYIRHYLEKHLDIVRKQYNKWECPICKSKVIHVAKEKHLRTHHDTTGLDPENIFKCTEPNCSAHFLRSHQLYYHLVDTHQKNFAKFPKLPENEDKPNSDSESQHNYFTCKICSKKFKLRSWLNRHTRNFHKRKTYKPRTKNCKRIFCDIDECTERFKSKEGLERHRKLHGKFKCNFCEIEMEYAPDLAIHETEHAIQTVSESMKEVSSNQSKKYNCPRCPYVSTIKTFYINHHVQRHLKLSMKTGTCKICGIEMMEKCELNHFRNYHNTEGVDPKEIHKCDQCPAYFLLGIQLINHKDKIHRKGDFKCVHCELTFSRRKRLVNHVRAMHPDIDESSLPEACDAPNCLRRFATKPELEWHTTYDHIYHEEDSGKVKCKVCEKVCNNQKGLRVHMRQHQETGKPKKLHVCDLCGKTFKMKCFLEKHVSFHAGPSSWTFECSECSKKCFSQQKLDEHMRTHSKEKPFVCEMCGQKFAHRHNYRGHMMKKHGVEVPKRQGNTGVNASRKGGRPRKMND